jgi:non-specific protein-tyrosine kinase
VYGAQAAFILTPRPDLSDTAVDQALQTQMLIVTSPKVLQPVADRTGVPVPVLEDEVAAGIQGRSTVLQITVLDPDQQRALAIARAAAEAYGSANPKPSGSQAPPITTSALTAAHALDQPVQPQPTRALAVGILVGLLAAGIVVVLLWRPWSLRRPAPYWT